MQEPTCDSRHFSGAGRTAMLLAWPLSLLLSSLGWASNVELLGNPNDVQAFVTMLQNAASPTTVSIAGNRLEIGPAPGAGDNAFASRLRTVIGADFSLRIDVGRDQELTFVGRWVRASDTGRNHTVDLDELDQLPATSVPNKCRMTRDAMLIHELWEAYEIKKVGVTDPSGFLAKHQEAIGVENLVYMEHVAGQRGPQDACPSGYDSRGVDGEYAIDSVWLDSSGQPVLDPNGVPIKLRLFIDRVTSAGKVRYRLVRQIASNEGACCCLGAGSDQCQDEQTEAQCEAMPGGEWHGSYSRCTVHPCVCSTRAGISRDSGQSLETLATPAIVTPPHEPDSSGGCLTCQEPDNPALSGASNVPVLSWVAVVLLAVSLLGTGALLILRTLR